MRYFILIFQVDVLRKLHKQIGEFVKWLKTLLRHAPRRSLDFCRRVYSTSRRCWVSKPCAKLRKLFASTHKRNTPVKLLQEIVFGCDSKFSPFQATLRAIPIQTWTTATEEPSRSFLKSISLQSPLSPCLHAVSYSHDTAQGLPHSSPVRAVAPTGNGLDAAGQIAVPPVGSPNLTVDHFLP